MCFTVKRETFERYRRGIGCGLCNIHPMENTSINILISLVLASTYAVRCRCAIKEYALRNIFYYI